MIASVEESRFVIDGLSYAERELARSCGFYWSKKRRVWMCPANLISALALVSSSRACDNVFAIRDWVSTDGKALPAFGFAGIKSRPMPHQVKGATINIVKGRFGLFFDMATGKTLTSLMVAMELFGQGLVKKVLILCPNSLFSTWKGEIVKHIGDCPVFVIWGTGKKRGEALAGFAAADSSVFPVFGMTSWDTLSKIKEEILKAPPQYVIGDESSFIKSRNARRTKAAIEVADVASYVSALTGTPYVSDVSDLWSQMRFVSSEYAGQSFWRFANRYIEFDNSPWRRPKGILPAMKNELKVVLDFVSMRVKKEEVLNLPEKIYQERVLEPGPEQKKLLKTMMKEFYFAVEAVKKGDKSPSQQMILIKNALGRVAKISQLTMGWSKNERGEIIRLKESSKLEALLDVFEECAGRKIVVFSRFIEDLEIGFEAALRIGRSPAIFHGGMSHENAGREFEEFVKGGRDILFSQVQKGGYGIDLSCASVCVYLTNWWSVGVRRQSEDRLHRPGQTGRVVYIDLMVKGTVDEMVKKALDQGRSISEYLFGKSHE